MIVATHQRVEKAAAVAATTTEMTTVIYSHYFRTFHQVNHSPIALGVSSTFIAIEIKKEKEKKQEKNMENK